MYEYYVWSVRLLLSSDSIHLLAFYSFFLSTNLIAFFTAVDLVYLPSSRELAPTISVKRLLRVEARGFVGEAKPKPSSSLLRPST